MEKKIGAIFVDSNDLLGSQQGFWINSFARGQCISTNGTYSDQKMKLRGDFGIPLCLVFVYTPVNQHSNGKSTI